MLLDAFNTPMGGKVAVGGLEPSQLHARCLDNRDRLAPKLNSNMTLGNSVRCRVQAADVVEWRSRFYLWYDSFPH